MRKLLSRGAFAALVCLAAGAAVWLIGTGSEAEEDPRFAPLIQRLGHEEFAQREAASEELAAVGESALPALRSAAATNDDLEIRLRAQQLVGAILLAVSKSKSTGLEMAVIEAGAATIGSPDTEGGRQPDEKSHRVRLTQSFLIGVYEVTQEEYEKVMGTNPSWYGPAGPGKDLIPDQVFTRLPVERVTWFDAALFCNRLSERDGLAPYYEIEDIRRDGTATKSAKVTIAGGSGYRLPTEAEWEYACRAGTATPYHFGGGSNGEKANVKGVSYTGYGGPVKGPDLKRTTRVGKYEPNHWGLYDMHGNVAEWCWDWYGRDYYAGSAVDDPRGPDSGQQRVQRGGSWLVNEASARSASRGFHTPDEAKEYAGFRVARTP